MVSARKRVLVVADEIHDALYGDLLLELKPDLVIACGDLPFDYLENLVSRLDRPLLFVPGNHDPDLHPAHADWMPLAFDPDGPGPRGCLDIDRRIVEEAGLVLAGLGGSPRYRAGPNQYSEAQMRRRALRLRLAARLRRSRVDILVTHAAPAGDDEDQDAVHQGFDSLRRLDEALGPRFHVHGHVRRYGPTRPDRRIGATAIVNAIPYRLLEV